jgi:hypothetical protein
MLEFSVQACLLIHLALERSLLCAKVLDFLIKPLPIIPCVIELGAKHLDLRLKGRGPVITADEAQACGVQDGDLGETGHPPLPCHQLRIFHSAE